MTLLEAASHNSLTVVYLYIQFIKEPWPISSLLSSFSNLNKGKPGALHLCEAAFLKLGNLNDILQPFGKQKKIDVSVNFCITRVMRSRYTMSNSLVGPTKENSEKRHFR